MIRNLNLDLFGHPMAYSNLGAMNLDQHGASDISTPDDMNGVPGVKAETAETLANPVTPFDVADNRPVSVFQFFECGDHFE
jgi:hypothetical protein